MRFLLYRYLKLYWISFVVLSLFSILSVAQTDDSTIEGPGPGPLQESDFEEEIVTYPSEFFQRYNPNNALDMVQQLPGFQIDNGADKRGFGGAAGNILINGRRPSTKEDLPSAILSRIPSSHVSHIELIRGQLENVDLRGQSVVANAVIREDLPATIRWEVLNSLNLDEASSPEGTVSITERLGEIEYNAGLLFRFTNFADSGPEKIFDADGNLIEKRFNDESTPGFEGWDLNSFLNASTWMGETLVQLNSKFGIAIRDEMIINSRFPQLPGTEPSRHAIENERRNIQFELGMDAERLLQENLLARGIVLFNYLHQYPDDSRRIFNSEDQLVEFRLVETNADHFEAIARGEFNWAGWQDHSVQFTAEGAFNVLDNKVVQTVDLPESEPFIDPIPGSNVRVEELRGDMLLKDILSLGNWVLDYSLGAEISTLSTSGDSTQKSTFAFVKPQALMTYAPSRQVQTRLRLARDIAQLDLNDFVSATVFLDDDLALGNPDLEPESTWVAEISHERRYGDLGVVTLTAFHHWIKDVEDLLPITSEFEAPGNIGDGRRWGVDVETTLPLSWLGMGNARLDVRARWQDSTVTDPVTGEKRVLSSVGGKLIDPAISFNNDTDFTYTIAYRQDFEDARVSWGWDIAEQGETPRFRTDELDVTVTGLHLNAFIETTRWWGVKIRLNGENILNYDEERVRTFYTGLRDLTPVQRRQVQNFTNGARLVLTVNGSFSL